MAKFLSTISSKALPHGFILFLVLAGLIEALSARLLASLPPRHSPQRVIQSLRETLQTDPKALILGDSFATNAFYAKDEILPQDDPAVADFLSLSTNTGVTFAGQYFLLKRFLKSHPPPERVFLIFSPGAWEITLGPLSDNHFFSLFTRWDEIAETGRMTRNPIYAVKMIYYKFFPSAQGRFYWAEFMSKSEAARNKVMHYLKTYGWSRFTPEKEKALFEISRPRPILEEGVRQAEIRDLPDTTAHPRQAASVPFNLDFFDKICGLAKTYSMKLYYLDATLPETEFYRLPDAYFGAVGRELERRCEVLTYANAMAPVAMADEWFYDAVHFNQIGSEIYLQEFSRAYKALVESGD